VPPWLLPSWHLGALGLDWSSLGPRRRRISPGGWSAQVFGIRANDPRADFVALATQDVAQSAKSLGVVRVLSAKLHQHALGCTQMALLEKRTSKQKVFADVGNVRRQRDPYYRNWSSLVVLAAQLEGVMQGANGQLAVLSVNDAGDLDLRRRDQVDVDVLPGQRLEHLECDAGV